MNPDPAMTFSLPGRHIFSVFYGPGFVCEACGGAWDALDAALKTRCGK